MTNKVATNNKISTAFSVLGDDIYDLAERKYSSPEILSSNDWYGHAFILKRYAGISNDYPIKASIHHGPFLVLHYAINDIGEFRAPFQIHISCSNIFASKYSKISNKLILPVGSFINYALPILNEEQIKNLKNKLGKVLLAFPMHSTEHLSVEYNIDKMCNDLEKLKSNFDTIIVYLYWKDILRGHADKFIKNGFLVETSGHMSNPFFLDRLKTALLLSDGVYTNCIGTHLGYAVSINRPVYLNSGKDFVAKFAEDAKPEDRWIYEMNKRLENQEKNMAYQATNVQLLKCFEGNSSFDLTADQLAAVNLLWGQSYCRTPDEIKKILMCCEDLHTPHRKQNIFGLVKKHIAENLSVADQASAKYIAGLCAASRPDDLTFPYIQARLDFIKGLVQEATYTIERLKEVKNDVRFDSNQIPAIVYDNTESFNMHGLISTFIVALNNDNYFALESLINEVELNEKYANLSPFLWAIVYITFNDIEKANSLLKNLSHDQGQAIIRPLLSLLKNTSIEPEDLRLISTELALQIQDSICQQ